MSKYVLLKDIFEDIIIKNTFKPEYDNNKAYNNQIHEL